MRLHAASGVEKDPEIPRRGYAWTCEMATNSDGNIQITADILFSCYYYDFGLIIIQFQQVVCHPNSDILDT